MTPAQRRKEIRLMIGWLEKYGTIDCTSEASSPHRYQIHMKGGRKHYGDAVSTHAYLSGATDMYWLTRDKEARI